MKLQVKRKWFTANSTCGELWIDGKFFCYTLEDVVRDGPKIDGKTAIPYGIYKLIIDLSSRFGRLMPHVLNVLGFTGIRIHNGNTDKDTDGCLLVGSTHSTDFVGNSKDTFNKLFELIKDQKDMTIEYVKEN